MRTASLHEPLRESFAQAYATAAQAGANMRAVTQALESLRETLLADGDVFGAWSAFDEQLAHASGSVFQPTMTALRARFVACAVGALVEEARAGGVTAWYDTFARCFGDGNWRYDLLRALIAARLPAVSELPAPYNDHARLDALAEQISTDRWSETYDWFIHLGNHSALESDLRLRMLVIAAEIQQYFFRRPGRVRALLDQAASLEAEHPRLLVGFGNLQVELNTPGSIEKAEDYFRKVLAARPHLSDGYVNLGQLQERAGDFAAAESFYEEAIANAPGILDSYRHLFRLLGKPQWFETRAARREDIGRRLSILQEDEAAHFVEQGTLLRANGAWEDARVQYESALSLKPRLLNARTWLVFSWVEEAADPKTSPERAPLCLQKAKDAVPALLADFPTAADPYWTATALYESLKDWEQAIAQLEQIRKMDANWEPSARIRMAAAWRNSGDLTAAAAQLQRTAEIEPEQTSLPLEYNELGEAAYRAKDRELALRCFEEAHRLGGDLTEYENRLGNLHFWFNEADTAAEHYRRALAVKPKDPVLYSNLALALASQAHLGQYEAAAREEIAVLAEAHRLAPAEPDYVKRLGEARRRLDFITRYGELALAYKHEGVPLRVAVSPALQSVIVNEGTSDINSDLLKLIENLRERIHRETGVVIPPWLFSVLADLDPDSIQIELLNERPVREMLTAQDSSAQIAEIVEVVSAWLQRTLPEFITHQETANLLQAADSTTCREIALHPLKLTEFVRFLRDVVAEGKSIADLPALAEQFAGRTNIFTTPEERSPEWSWEKAPPGTTLQVFVGSELAAEKELLKQDLDQARLWLLDFTGLLLPQISVSDAEQLFPGGFKLFLNENQIVVRPGLRSGELWVSRGPEELPAHWEPKFSVDASGTVGSIVRAAESEARELLKGEVVRSPVAYASFALGFEFGRHSVACIDPAQVEHRLALIAASQPTLVESARARFSRDELVEALRTQATRTRSLRCFPSAIEELLTDVKETALAA